MSLPSTNSVIAEPRDHGRVVGAELQRRENHLDAFSSAEPLAEVAVGGNAAARDDPPQARVTGRRKGPVDQDVDGRLLERGRDVRQALAPTSRSRTARSGG